MQAPDLARDPAVQAIVADVSTAVAHATEFRITTIEEREFAANECIRLNSLASRLETERLKITRPMDAAKQAVMDFFRPRAEQLTGAVMSIKRAMRVWDDEQERIRLEEQRRQEEIARRERERLQREADERQREADRKAAEERQAAEAARSAGNIAEAEKHDRKADQVEQRAAERVEVLQERASTVVAPVIPTAAPKVSGVSGRLVWKYRVKDINLVPREYMKLDEQKTGGVVRAMKGDTNIPGIEVYSERDYAASRRGAA